MCLTVHLHTFSRIFSVRFESSLELPGHRDVRGYENRCIRVKISRPTVPAYERGKTRHPTGKQASQFDRRRNAISERRQRLHRAHRDRNSFRAHSVVRKSEGNNYDYLDIPGVRRGGTHFANRTITSTRGVGTRHPS